MTHEVSKNIKPENVELLEEVKNFTENARNKIQKRL